MKPILALDIAWGSLHGDFSALWVSGVSPREKANRFYVLLTVNIPTVKGGMEDGPSGAQGHTQCRRLLAVA